MATDALPEKIGPYKIVGILGKGGMGAVYRAYKPPLTRQVAVKIIKAEFVSSPGALERFRREAELASDLKHPNIVTVYDYEEVLNGDSYIVTELIEGGVTLRDRLNQGKLSYREISDVINQISSALDYAYETRNIVHRDVKPSNIFFEANKRVALGDFGIAKDVSRNTQLTSLGEGVGTPDYMSPEQAMGEPLDRRSDVYSLGVILFEMLSGRLPFTGDTPITVVMGHIQKEIPSLRQIDPNIPSSVETVVKKALAKKPDGRYSSAGELAKAFATAAEKANQEAGQTMALGDTASKAVSDTLSQKPASDPISQQLSSVTALESQQRFQDAFNVLHELRMRNPQNNDLNNRYNRYATQGYRYTGTAQQPYTPPMSTPNPFPTQPRTYNTPYPNSAPTAGGYLPQQPQPMAIQPAKKGAPLAIIVGGSVAAVAIIAIVIVILATAGGNKPTPTVQAVATVTATAAPTSTTAPSPTAAPTVTPARTTPTPSVPPATPTISGGSNTVKAAALNAEAETLLDNGEPYGAIEKLKEALQLDPGKLLYLDNLARAYIDNGDYALAEPIARQAVNAEPNNARYHNRLGVALDSLGKYDLAIEQYREAIKLSPNTGVYHRNLAGALNDKGDYKAAETSALKAVELEATEPKAHNMLGIIQQNLGRDGDAEKSYKKAFELNSKSAVYATNISIVQYNQEKYPDAENSARIAVGLDNTYSTAYYQLSIAQRAQNKLTDALANIRKAIEIDPEDPYNVRELASLLYSLKQYDEALPIAQKAVKLDPQSSRGQVILGNAYYTLNKFQDALIAYQAATLLTPSNATYVAYVGDAYAKLADYPKAREQYNAALKIDPNNKTAKDGLDAIKNK